MTIGPYPGGKRFAFTIFDDTDVATLENVRPIYRLLEELGMRTTKTVWPEPCPEGSENFSSSETLEDAEYREFVIDLQRRGFEIASHGATMESSRRERTVAGLERMHDTFGMYPRCHANHAYNRENLYWGAERIDVPLIRAFYGRFNGMPRDHYQGGIEGSPYWWGDLCARHFTYVRNLSFDEINLAKINPSMPYYDPRRPLAQRWFSSSDAEDAEEFNYLTRPARQEQLEREGGFCIVSTHLGKGFERNGEVHPVTRERLEALARRSGWFPTVGELLDWLASRRTTTELPAPEWQRMQWRWISDLVRRRWKLRQRRRRGERI